MTSTRNWINGFLVGAVIGGIAALLNAPRSGKETRQQITHKSDEIYQQARDSYQRQRNNLESQIESVSTKARNRSKNLAEIGRDFIEEQRATLGRGAERVRNEVIEAEREPQPGA